MLAVLLFIGATAITIVAERLNVATGWLIAIGVASYVGAALIAWWPRWKAAWRAFWPDESKPTNDVTVRVLERYYMRLLLEVEHARRLQFLEMETGEHRSGDWYQAERRIEELRSGLINAPESILTMVTRLEFQKPALLKVDVKERVLTDGEALLKKIHQKWHAYGGDKIPTPVDGYVRISSA